MANEDFQTLKDLALIHFKTATLRGATHPAGLAVQMRDGSVHGWDNVPSDAGEGDEILAMPLARLIEGCDIQDTSDLSRSQEVAAVLICTDHTISQAFKDALAAYIGMPDDIRVTHFSPAIDAFDSFRL